MKDKREGLPEHLFEYISSITPMVNVDLLIHNPNKGVILSWRSDKFYGPGWHIPGGIIRFKESLITRLKKVALKELNIEKIEKINFQSIYQIMNPTRDVRGHFLSLLFSAEIGLVNNFELYDSEKSFLPDGACKWHTSVPVNLIPQHKRYGKIIDDILKGNKEGNLPIGNILSQYDANDEKSY